MARPIDIRKIINANISYYMNSCNLEPKDVAKIMGCSTSTINRRMNLRDDGAFDALQLQRFATKCKCTVADLVTAKEIMSARDAEIDAMLKWWRAKGREA